MTKAIQVGDFIQVKRLKNDRLFAIFCPLSVIHMDDCEMHIYKGAGTAVFAALALLGILDPILALEQNTFLDGPWEVFTVKGIE